MPTWALVAGALTIVTAVLIAAKLVSMLVLLPVLLVSSLGRRFSTVATRIEVQSGALSVGQRRFSRTEIVDVWHDARAEGSGAARVIVAVVDEATPTGAGAAELLVLHFENAEQARRFAGAFPARECVVVGHRPRAVDALTSLRFVGLAIAFFATGSWFGAFALAYFAFGALSLVRATQFVARADAFETHSLFRHTRHAYADVAAVDVDAGVVRMNDGSEVVLSRAAIRDTTLSPPAWLDDGRRRVLERVAAARS